MFFTRSNQNDLVISFKDNASDQITISNWFSSTDAQIERLVIGNNEYQLPDLVNQALYTQTGTNGNDVLYGTIHNDVLLGGAGNDVLYAIVGSDYLDGGAGDDKLYATYANNTEKAQLKSTTFVGGTGNDFLRGTLAGDVYVFNKGDGQDIIQDAGNDTIDPTNTNYIGKYGSRNDAIEFGTGVKATDLSFIKSERRSIHT